MVDRRFCCQPGYDGCVSFSKSFIVFVVGAGALLLASKFGLNTFSNFLLDNQASLGLSDLRFSTWSGAARSPTAFGLGILLAYIADRFGNMWLHYIFATGLIASLISLPLLLESFGGLLIANYLFTAFGVAFLSIVVSAIYRQDRGELTTTQIGILVSLGNLGAVASYLARGEFDPISAVNYSAGVMLIGAVGMAINPAWNDECRNTTQSIKHPKNGSWLLLVAATFAFTAIHGMGYWGFAMIIRTAGTPFDEIAHLGLLPALGICAGLIIGGLSLDRGSDRPLRPALFSAVIGNCVVVVGLLSLLLTDSTFVLVTLTVVVAFGGGLVTTGTLAAALTLSTPQRLATAVALALFAMHLGLIIGPLPIGVLSDYYYNNQGTTGGDGLRMALAWGSLASALAIVTLWLVATRHKATI